MRIDDLDTPAVICDLEVMERNIAGMAARCGEIGIPFRAHTKSHKNPEIAHLQMKSGAIGICCQKVGEAEVMVQAGLEDILIPFNIVGEKKVERLTRLARRATITVAVDSEATARGISARAAADGVTVRAVVEMDTGAKRCGVQSPAAAVELGRVVAGLPGIDFQGVMTYPSRSEAKPFLDEVVHLYEKDGLPLTMIGGGGTGLEEISKELGCSETRSGSYVWEGNSRVKGRDDLGPERCPVRVLCTVVSVPTADRIIIDGGAKTFASYPPVPYGYCVEHPEIFISGVSIEHGHVDTSASSHKFRVGERLTMIPLHQEMCLNLHDEMVGVRNGDVEVIWPILGRGKVK